MSATPLQGAAGTRGVRTFRRATRFAAGEAARQARYVDMASSSSTSGAATRKASGSGRA